jgi:FkbM family methyltransferase
MLPRINLVRTDSTDYLLFSTDECISKAIFDHGEWGSVNLMLANILCEGIEQPLVLDIGANLGAFCVPLAQKLAGRGGLVYAFEPQRVVFYQLCANIFLNRLDCCIAYNWGIGDQEGVVKLQDNNYSSSNLGAYSLIEEYQKLQHLQKPSADALMHTVPVRALDNFEFPRDISFIKIDVEGMEIQVLKGALAQLKASAYPPIMLEVWDVHWFKEQRAELLEYIKRLGYELFFYNGEDAIAQYKKSSRYINFVIDQQTNTLSYHVTDNS